MTGEEIRHILHLHLPELRERFGVQEIALFGSCARGDQAVLSDVDLLVTLGRPLGWESIDLHEYLEALPGAQVDLLTREAVMQKPLLWQSIREDLVRV
jgi:predicted nucleotidyltransferase